MNSRYSQRCGVFLRAVVVAASVSLISAPAVGAQDTAAFFETNCSACHSVGGGPRMGPDLKDVLQRKDRKWLVDFLVNPQATLDKDDPYGKKLLADAQGMVMPTVDGVDRARADALLDWIDARSKGASPRAAGAQPAPGGSASAQDIEAGQRIVLGSQLLANGGPSCSSCHTLRGLPSPGGGALGPDLTNECTRLGGRAGLTAWLNALPTPTMQSVYKPHPLTPAEITALAAYLESLSKSQSSGGPSGRLLFATFGLGGCLVALALMEALWKKRFTAVRRPLVAVKRS